MQKATTVKPPEFPTDSDPVTRLLEVLEREGFRSLSEEDGGLAALGERVYHRAERVSFVRGETVFVLIDFPALTEKVLSQAMEGITNLFRAKRRTDKALSFFQPTTVYVCIIARSESPHTASLNRYISTAGGAIIIPVIVIPDINQVVYPSVEEKVGTVRPRVEFLQFVLGERREAVQIHEKTVRTFYVSLFFVTILLIAAIVTFFV